MPWRDVGDLDPSAITLAHEYGVFENLLSPLIEEDLDGQMVPALADNLTWTGKELHLHIRDNAKTASGLKITADDAMFTLKRLLVLSRNTHGRLGEILCPDQKLTRVEDPCDGIAVSGNELVFRPKFGHTFLVPMLTAIDFGVLIRSTVDPVTLKIKSYAETSGPYYLSKLLPNGDFVMKANPNHWHYRKDIPQTVAFRVNKQKSTPEMPGSLKQFIDHETDFVPSSNIYQRHLLTEYVKTHSDAQVDITENFFKIMLLFTDKGMKELPESTRLGLGSVIQNTYWSKAVSPIRQNVPARQWFAEQGDGNLTADQHTALRALFAKAPKPVTGVGLKISTFPQLASEAQNLLHDVLPGLQVEADMLAYYERQEKNPKKIDAKDPQMLIIGTDALWNENISFLSYSFSMNEYPMTFAEGNSWIRKYMDTEKREIRIKMLRDLHYNALRSGKVVPLLGTPQISMVRRGWKIEHSPIFASNAIWRIHRD